MHIQKSYIIISIAFLLCLAACQTTEEITLIKTDEIDVSSNTDTQGKAVNEDSEILNIIPFDESMWNMIFDLDMVAIVEIDANERVWTMFGSGEIALYEDDVWEVFSSEDFGFDDYPRDLEIAQDGTAWILGNKTISRYIDGIWESFKIPGSEGSEYKEIAVDPSGNVWVASSKCENGMYLYNNMDWELFMLPDECSEINQLISSPDGSIWASFYYRDGIGKFNNGEWTVYTGENFSLATGPYYGVERISIDDLGNVYGLYWGYDLKIIRIGTDESLTNFGFDPDIPKINPTVLNIYADKTNSIWVNACPSDEGDSCLAYYNDNIWTYFIDLPISSVFDIEQKADGSLLIASGKGLYHLDYK